MHLPQSPHRPTDGLSSPSLVTRVAHRATVDPQTLGMLVAIGLAAWFTSPQHTWSLAAWLLAILLVRFLRHGQLWARLLVAWPLMAAVAFFSNPGFAPLDAATEVVLAAGVWLLGLLPYIADRLVARHSAAFASTLVLPAAAVSLEYALTGLYTGTINSVAYTQAGVLPLVQVVSVTGIWGILFLLFWAASIVNWAWDSGFASPRVWRGIGLYAAILALVVGVGAMRLLLTPSATHSVSVATLAPDPLGPFAAAYTAVTGREMLVTSGITPSSPETAAMGLAMNAFIQSPDESRFAPVHAALAVQHDELFASTEREVRAGAKIIVWAEGNAQVLQAGEAALVERGQRLAREHGMYLFMPFVVYKTGHDAFGAGGSVANKIVAIGPSGDILATYYKNKLPPGETSEKGDGKLALIDTLYGRIALAICYDLNSPDLARQAGLARADLLIAPSSDWLAVKTRQVDSARLRAVENGVTLVRPSIRGLTAVADPYGRSLVERDWFAGQTTLHMDVPIQVATTVYPRIGDVLAYLSASGLAILAVAGILAAVRRHAARRSALRTAPVH